MNEVYLSFVEIYIKQNTEQGVKPILYSYKFLYFGEIPIISYIELKFPIIPIKSVNVKKYSKCLILTHST